MPTQVFLSHSTFRKRAKQEYTRICQAKRAKLLSHVRSEMKENREFLQSLAGERGERPPPAVKPLPPEPCAGVELLRSASVSFTNSCGKTTYVKVRLRLGLCSVWLTYTSLLVGDWFLIRGLPPSFSSGSSVADPSAPGPPSLQHVVLNTAEFPGGG